MKRTLFLALALSASFVQSDIIQILDGMDNQNDSNSQEKDTQTNQVISNGDLTNIEPTLVPQVPQTDLNDLNKPNEGDNKLDPSSQKQTDTSDLSQPTDLPSQEPGTEIPSNSSDSTDIPSQDPDAKIPTDTTNLENAGSTGSEPKKEESQGTSEKKEDAPEVKPDQGQNDQTTDETESPNTEVFFIQPNGVPNNLRLIRRDKAEGVMGPK